MYSKFVSLVVITGIAILAMLHWSSRKEVVTQEVATANRIRVDVVIEDIDYSAHTISARGSSHVIAPHRNVGGVIFLNGATGVKEIKVSKYIRLPVLPEADLEATKPQVGQRAALQLEVVRNGCLVVAAIENSTDAPLIGVDFLDVRSFDEGQ